MNLEQSVKYHAAKSQSFTDAPRATGETLQGADVLAALGMAQSAAPVGMSLFFGKMGVSEGHKEYAIKALAIHARKRSAKFPALSKLEGRKKARALQLVSLFAFNDYCVTADTPGARCKYCKGRGSVLDVDKTVEAHERITKPCKRCSGAGFHKPPSSNLFRALKAIIPDLTQPTFSRNVKPLLDELITYCYAEESKADEAIRKATR